MSGYAFHPDVFADLDEIWEYIAQDSGSSPQRVIAIILSKRDLRDDIFVDAEA